MTPRQGRNERSGAATYGAERGLDRFEGFSDAVFAIALTLLIVEIKVPGSPEGRHDYTDLARAMAEQWREFLALGLCYTVIGAYWLQHHYSGRIYAKSDHWFGVEKSAPARANESAFRRDNPKIVSADANTPVLVTPWGRRLRAGGPSGSDRHRRDVHARVEDARREAPDQRVSAARVYGIRVDPPSRFLYARRRHV
jgi:hypothetical protein